MNIVILAAGSGKRMRSDLPKVLHPLAGQPLLSHVIATARALAPRRIVVVVGHGGEQVKATVAADDVSFVEQREQLGTGHALLQAMPLLDAGEPTLVLYGDVPLTQAATLAALHECAARAGGPFGYGYAILTVELDDPAGYGRIVRDANGSVRAIVEQKDADAEQLRIREVNTGIVTMPTAPLAAWLRSLDNRNAQGEFYLTDVVARALADGVPVVTASAPDVEETLGVNSRLQLAQLERAYQLRQANRLLDAGVSLRDPARVDVRGELLCGRDVTIDVNVVFEGRVELGDGVSIGPNCVLRDVSVGAGSRIDAFSHLEKARIGARAVIGPYARLRPGAQLADDVHVGNFVEIKQASIGTGSKANHLSYIGDARVGRGVNIGAGTITCNYDGANKHLTVIEDEVFVGSDSQLVAPVTIGHGATIGAGTTVWRDVGANELALNGKTQVARPGHVRPVKDKA